MHHRIRVAAEAKRDLRELPGHVRERAWRLIDSLADQPRPLGAKELRDNPGVYRLRLDRWRLSYEVPRTIRSCSSSPYGARPAPKPIPTLGD